MVPVGKIVAIVAIVSIVLCAAACGSSAITAATSTSGTRPVAAPVTVPAGWHSYTYGRATISAPADWVVATSKGCPSATAQGILALGAPKLLVNCPAGVDSVVVGPFPSGDTGATAGCPPIALHGLVAYVLPCHSGAGTNIVEYLVPALGVEAVGSGTTGENVSGTGTNTVVGQVLHTLR